MVEETLPTIEEHRRRATEAADGDESLTGGGSSTVIKGKVEVYDGTSTSKTSTTMTSTGTVTGSNTFFEAKDVTGGGQIKGVPLIYT